MHGELTLQSFSAQAMADKRVLQLAQRVTPLFVPVTDAARQAVTGTVHLRAASGRTASNTVEVLLGSPHMPLDDTMLGAKFRNCAALALPAWSTHDLDGLFARMLQLENLPSTTALLSFSHSTGRLAQRSSGTGN